MTEAELMEEKRKLDEEKLRLNEMQLKQNQTQTYLNQQAGIMNLLHDKGIRSEDDLKNVLNQGNQGNQNNLSQADSSGLNNPVYDQQYPQQNYQQNPSDEVQALHDTIKKHENFMMFLHSEVQVEKLRHRVNQELENNSQGLEHVKKAMNDNVLHNLSHRLNQQNNKGLRGELQDINQNYINLANKFTNLSIKPVDIKAGKQGTPQLNMAQGNNLNTQPSSQGTLPSHGSGLLPNQQNNTFKYEKSKDGSSYPDFRKADKEFEKQHAHLLKQAEQGVPAENQEV